MGASKRGDTALDGASTGEWARPPRDGDTEEEPAHGLGGVGVVSPDFLDDKPTRFDFRPPEFPDDTALEEAALPEAPAEDEEVEVPMMSVEEAMRASDPALGFSDGTEEHAMKDLSPTGEGDDEFESATVPTRADEAELMEAMSAALESVSPGITPDGVDPRSVDPRGPTVRRALAPEPEPEPSVFPPGRASITPESRPSWRAPVTERVRGARSLQVQNRASLAPFPGTGDLPKPTASEPPPPPGETNGTDTRRSVAPGAPPSRPSKAPGPPRPSLLPPMLQTDDIRIIEHVEAAKRTAKVMPIAIAGGLGIAFAWVAFGGGDLANMSEEMKQEAAQVYASRAALRSEDKEHAADPLIRIESDPPGARVEVNNVEIGRTPLLAPSPYSNAEYFLVVMREGQETWQAYLKRDLRVARRIEVIGQRYDAAPADLPRDKNGLAVVRVVLRPAK